MTSSALTDLDPPPARERRWPFYVTWTLGSFLVGAVLLLPESTATEAVESGGAALYAHS